MEKMRFLPYTQSTQVEKSHFKKPKEPESSTAIGQG